mmetsp:Transcript_10562/g.33465  ORF Transcript_10562/g.33465 Transcript_10562/m.33465 type:complete len:214 (-) Transcript_10562:47-688(-)
MPLPLVLTGPSGVGKGTLIRHLMAEFPEMTFSVSHTTRAPREGEVDGIHYHFVPKDEMEKLIESGKFIEHANVHGNLYGTSYAAVADATAAGHCPILDIDVQGAQLVSANPDFSGHFVFVKPPRLEALKERLLKRGTETTESMETRLHNAIGEIEVSKEAFWDAVFVNDDFDECYRQLSNFAEKNIGLKRASKPVPLSVDAPAPPPSPGPPAP